MRRLILAAALAAFGAGHAIAHTASSSYLELTPHDSSIAVRLSVALRDLNNVIDLDTDNDGKIEWGELRAHEPQIAGYAQGHLTISTDGAACDTEASHLRVDHHSDGGYAVLDFDAACPAKPHRIGIRYSLFFDIDQLHRGLARLTLADGAVHSFVLSPESPDVRIELSSAEGGAGFADTVKSYFETGVDHLLTGVDHMLFITMLLVPAVFRRQNGRFIAAGDLRSVIIESFKVLSAFTVAHGTTLTLSVLHIVSIPERLSESGIALTVLITALDNLFGFLPSLRWPLAFAFGLVHGLGFATALGPLDLPGGALATALLAFSAGLEAAQLMIALTVLPLGFWLRDTVTYRMRVVPGVSAAVGLLAMAWFVDRAAGLGLVPF